MTYTDRDEKRDSPYTNRQTEREREELTAGHSSAADKAPASPASDDESPLGDTDQHSDA